MQTSAKSIIQFFARLHFFNAGFCTFLQSLRSEQGMSLVYLLVMLIVISNPFYSNALDDILLLFHVRRIRFCIPSVFRRIRVCPLYSNAGFVAVR